MKDHQLKSYHTPDAIEECLKKGPSRSYLRDFIYGAIDGAVTTFAVVSGVAGAQLSFGIVIILGIANVIADGFSMAISNFLRTRAEEQLIERARRREEHHIEMVPDGEREEIRQIYSRKGFDGEALERIIEVICADKKLWVDTMITEEWGLTLESPSPWRAAMVTFSAFVLIGILPLIPFIIHTLYPSIVNNPFLWSSFITAIAFFTVGACKSKLLELRWYKGGLETLIVGGSAAALAYLAGYFLKGLS